MMMMILKRLIPSIHISILLLLLLTFFNVIAINNNDNTNKNPTPFLARNLFTPVACNRRLEEGESLSLLERILCGGITNHIAYYIIIFCYHTYRFHILLS